MGRALCARNSRGRTQRHCEVSPSALGDNLIMALPPPSAPRLEQYAWLGRRWSLAQEEWLSMQRDWPENQDVSARGWVVG